MIEIEGHAIVSADGMIADGTGDIPSSLRNAADWRQYQAALDRAAIVVSGRRGHERHPNPGRRRLVLTRSVEAPATDPRDPLATLWNPARIAFDDVLATLGVTRGIVAITGLFDLFLERYDRFVLSENHPLVLPGGIPCFAAGHPRTVLTQQGLRPRQVELIDRTAMVTTTVWERAR